MAKDVVVVVQRDALPTTKESLDILLISTTGEYPVATYRDIESVEAVYGPNGPCPNSKIVRKAKTLLNQGKTTLAESLIDKFKIVSFAPPSVVPATAARLVVTFPVGTLPNTIAVDTDLTMQIGGLNDDVKVTATASIATGEELAALFNGTFFNHDGKTYVASVAGAVVTYTATTGGEVDTIPAMVDFITAANVSGIDPTVKFHNGTNTITAPEALANALKKFQLDEDDDWYFFMADRDEPEYVKALAKFAEASEPSEAELGTGVEDRRKFYMGQTSDLNFKSDTARAAVIYTQSEYLDEEPDASYTGNVGPFYPKNVTWKFKRPQDGNAPSSEGSKLITLPKLTEGERNQLIENNVNFLTEEYKRQYVKEGVCLNGDFIDTVLGGDWIAKRMRDLLYDMLLNNANISYDDAGFGFIATAVLKTLAEAADDDHNIVARDPESRNGIFTVTIPKWAESTDEQRRNRVMPDITWEALLSGAIHQVKTKGVLRVSL